MNIQYTEYIVDNHNSCTTRNMKWPHKFIMLVRNLIETPDKSSSSSLYSNYTQYDNNSQLQLIDQ